MSLLLALLLQAAPEAPAAETCDKPVYMVVAGRTLDRERMLAYGKALAESEIYQRLGGYYVTLPQPVAVFEGDVPPDYVNLTVRFPCLANARAFWNSRVYQETILPLRQNPAAGDYTVTVYAEMPLRPDMAGRVEAGRFLADFSGHDEPQVEAAE
ncbi:MAG: hypothetical protein ABS49_11680 [Erythrobacter sp. SCN 62-14]|nr:MAG: hypothetical protein ABS49_11680 [Erythrobacter sp. SCN 62-14]